MVRTWLMFGSIWLWDWVLEGAESRVAGCWTFSGVAELPFGPEDVSWLRRLVEGTYHDQIIADVSARLSRWVSVATQMPEGWQRAAPAPVHPREPRGLEVGPPPPDLNRGHPYPGIGVDNLHQRLRAFFEGFGGTFLGCDATPHVFRRLVMVEFYVALPFTDDASWRHEGGRRLDGPTPRITSPPSGPPASGRWWMPRPKRRIRWARWKGIMRGSSPTESETKGGGVVRMNSQQWSGGPWHARRIDMRGRIRSEWWHKGERGGARKGRQRPCAGIRPRPSS